MLHPQERQYLLEALRPPDGKRVDYVVGTTFSLDLLALLTVPLSFTFFEFEERDGTPVRDPIPVMEALRRNAGKIAIFAQAGRTKVPTGNRLLNVFIEQAVHMVNPKSGGVFHPKVWALRFLDDEGRASYRVLCLSRNLTYDRSWDTVLCLEGDVAERSNAIAANHPLGELLESLPGLAISPVPEATREKIVQIQHELRRTRFDAPDGMTGPWFWNFGIGSTRKNPLFGEASALTIISPFLSAGFLQRAIEDKKEAYLVSRRDSLDALPLPLLEKFKAVYFFDTALESEMQSGEVSEDGAVVANDTLYGLHAKLYIVESNREADVFTGSANATTAAFSTNVEFLTQLGGTIYKHGARALFGDGEEAGVLKKLLCLYERKGEPVVEDSFEAAFETARAQTVATLCSADLHVECREDAEGGYHLTLVLGEAAAGNFPEGVHVYCRPASLSDFALQEVTTAARSVEFNHASFKAITSFFIFEIRYELDGREQSDSFVLNLPLRGAPDDRSSRVVCEFIQDKDNFLRLLLLILGLMDPSQGFPPDGPIVTGNGASWLSGSSQPLFELLVRAVSRHPEKIDEIRGIITHLLKTEEGRSALPQGFLEIWDPILQARQELHPMNRPNLEKILAPLKDFQRETADYIFKRMFLDEDCTHRFLLADEVGLGKTLVARGVIAKTIDHLWDNLKNIKRIDIVYICSNAEIARQNISRLNIVEENKFTLASRLTLLPLTLTDMKSRSLNFVSFTPATSFDHKSSTGMYKERALLYHLLERPLGLEGVKPINVLQGDVTNTDWWRKYIYEFPVDEIDSHLASTFARTIKSSEHKQLRKRFRELVEVFGNRNHQPTVEERQEQRSVIGEFREILAQTCLNALEPDLIIMDEFQRFRHLLDEGEGEENQIAKSLFNYTDEHTQVRILLMSATPYRMYTLNQEQSEDHYKDFLATYGFLCRRPERVAEFEILLERFRKEIFHLRGGSLELLLQTKSELERELRKYIVRTERLATGTDRNGMLQSHGGEAPVLKPGDLRSFVLLDRIGELLDNGNILEYWKSAPYLLNFMEGYDVKKRFEEALEEKGKKQEVLDVIKQYESCVLSQDEINAYASIDPGNARLRALMRDVFDRGAWKLLWLPPSRPYYEPRGVFADPGLRDFTKRLIFSAWNVVPKAVATLMSYEAERRIALRFNAEMKNTEEDRKRRRALLRFRKAQGREASMPVLALVYPCRFFAERCDPLQILETHDGALPSQEDMLLRLRERITEGLEKVNVDITDDTREDERWYWAAPLLLDMAHFRASTVRWMLDDKLPAKWNGEQKEEADEEGEGSWGDHVALFRETGRDYVKCTLALGPKPDDLVEVLSQLALAGFGSVAYRALSRVLPAECFSEVAELRNAAGSIAWSFLSLFNTPESIALLRGFNGAEPFWRRVLEYCIDGNLQSVLDEFVHVQHDIQGLIRKSETEIVEKLEAITRSVLSLRAARVGVHDVTRVEKDGLPNLENFGRLRFAARFQKERSEAGSEETRREIVRDAFNSPFWPFVLVSTSIGQEGLDFHCYCHAVVHWNLPTNPVDLEQREGRVHRYKGHAIRKNISHDYGSVKLDGARDLWSAMFAQAVTDRPAGESDISPYWMYARPGGAVIERHVPVLPLSRDEERLGDLRKSLAVYRMVFGQSRQEDLLAFLMKQIEPSELEATSERLKIDLRPGV